MAAELPYKPRPGEIPTDPGVYRFRDAQGRVLYVGKAKNLRQRLSNYFAPLRTLHERTRRMVTTAASVEWTVVPTDVDSLQLEYMWIKEFDPPFNVRYKDDKSYPFMAITLADEAPRVIVTRNRRIPGAKYFGPYPKVWTVHDTIDQMIRVFPIRTCSDASYRKAMATGRPCFPGQIGKCGGPCSMTVTIAEHRAMVDDFIAFMEGGDERFTRDLTRRMHEASAAMDYESAAKYRDRLASIDAVLGRSALVLPQDEDADLFGVAEDELSAAIQHFVIRGGRVRGVRASTLDKEIDISGADLVDQILQRAYGEASGDQVPRRVLVPSLPEDAAELEEWLRERRGRKVEIAVAQRGQRAELMRTATLNAQQALIRHKTRRSSDYTTRTQALTDLQEALGLDEAPLRIECYDISHLGGTNVVASMVVFEDGLPRKDQYRSFNIAETTDDTDSIYQVLRRRLAHIDAPEEPEEARPVGALHQAQEPGEELVVTERRRPRFAYPPQLLIVDGGKPQVEAAARALRDAGRSDIALCGIAKRLEELWLPGDEYPVILPRTSEALYLVQRLRDEAHRFAITHQRKRRKRDIASILGEVPGLGAARIKSLLRHFGSVAALRRASAAEIQEVQGIGPALAEAIRVHLASEAVPAKELAMAGAGSDSDASATPPSD
ncbi:excinuclease ABC subunit UvrC [Microbacterium azadirachtae]|uniref:UvrABC system protein C n=1 Tax=Microbacterium azadirachtae TaxID=582680 RepID=A0A0F0KDT8_9MICO|nr:excinuclease ABC subunit UvrC [Microbacterium azadirachtae]KJL17436.1 UvrABC system protein C [Microbacterium azadirachtae]UXW87269.1 excinuclease ABC subunit UvrC [Microbacterium azadirachtae]SDL16625.1 Excinuclease ABC subunit C [Microbacterium azadirachtae]SEF46581.1 Excinuclease ABC subunit C [Microbacterium azadirachtae]SEF46610.1 Excinuclease ABC subunit C [Microbacterium azadirachtae]